MENVSLSNARKFVSKTYGKIFEEKATDQLCLSLYMPLLLESRGIRESLKFNNINSFLLEFKEENKERTVKEPAINYNVNRVQEVLNGNPMLKSFELELREMKYRSRIKNEKEVAVKSVQQAASFLERRIERSFSRETRSLDDQPYLTQLCWLNRTVKTIASPNTLAEVIQEKGINSIDLPRKIRREIDKTTIGISAPQYRNKFSVSGKDITVAVIDSEIALEHPALQGRVIQMKNFTKEPWGNPDYHGTAVAGIIGSSDMTYTGIAPNVQLYNYKILATDPNLDSDDFEGVLAIQTALEDGIHIANCSWGSGQITNSQSREARACNAAWELGLTIVKSAGNDGPGPRTLTRPGDADGIIVVGAVSMDGRNIEEYSSRGPIYNNDFRPHMLAPGGSAVGTITSCLIDNSFGISGTGTSYSAPHVTGLLALLLEKNPNFSNDNLKEEVIKLCTKINGYSHNDQGYGVVSLSSLVI